MNFGLKSIRPVVFLMLVFAFPGCDDDEAIPQKIFTLNVDQSYITGLWHSYVMIHDINGNLIDYQNFATGQVVTVETTREIPGDRFTVTFGGHDIRGHDDLVSYIDVVKGSTWTITMTFGALNPIGNEVGSMGVLINIPGGCQGSITNRFGYPGEYEYSDGRFWMEVPVHELSRDFFVYVADNDGNPRYKMLRDVQADDRFDFAFDELDEFDKVVDINFPATTEIHYFVKGYNDDQPIDGFGYSVTSNALSFRSNAEQTNIKLGYPSEFEKFSTYVSVEHSGFEYRYSKAGSPPSSIVLPLAAAFANTNASITDFEFTHNQAFASRRSVWGYLDTEDDVTWAVYAPPGSTQKFNELPEEFAAKYPKVDFEKMTFRYSEFTVQGLSYDTMLGVFFGNENDDPQKEVYQVVQR